ncbi:hypothetical protein GCM10010975_13440 [Comamonas phosphati]|nr:hypothetical protein GCM10010975_13440 [Comamonas phosphati]
MAAHNDGYSPRCSCTILTARSRTSGENLFDFFMKPLEVCPTSGGSSNPGRFRYAISDGPWERIKDLLPGQVGQPGATARDNRLFIDAVLYRYRAGIAWRDLPARFGDF